MNRAIAPSIKNAVDFKFTLPSVAQWELSNGVKVYALQAGEEEVVQLEWVFFAGNSHESANMIAAATNHLLKNGTSQHSAFDINEHFEFYGSYLNRNCYNETSNITLHCLARQLPHVLPMVQQLITDSVFPQEELDIFKTNSQQRLQVNLKKCDFVATREIEALLYGKDHPYGKYSTSEALDALTREQLLQFYNAYYRHGSCVLFVAGKLPNNMYQLLDQYFGCLPLLPAVVSATAPLPLPTALVPPRQIRIENDAQGVQGAIRMARHFPNRHHPDFQGVAVLNVVLGGFFGSRLMSNIREEKGYTYGIHSYIQNHVGPCAWMISTEAGRDVCEAAIAEVYVEMERLRQEPIPADELLLVRNYMLGSILGDLDGPLQIINRWKSYVLTGVNEEYFYNAIAQIKTVSAAHLQELANKYLKPEAFYEMVVV